MRSSSVAQLGLQLVGLGLELPRRSPSARLSACSASAASASLRPRPARPPWRGALTSARSRSRSPVARRAPGVELRPPGRPRAGSTPLRASAGLEPSSSVRRRRTSSIRARYRRASAPVRVEPVPAGRGRATCRPPTGARRRRRRRLASRRRAARWSRCSGPNGAGKTTTVETLEGYRRPAAGPGAGARARPGRRPRRARAPRIGVMLQDGRRVPGHPGRSRPCACSPPTTTSPPTPTRCSTGWAWPTGPARRGAASRAASSSACRWRWPWSAGPRSPSSTSPPRASTSAAGPGRARGRRRAARRRGVRRAAHHPRARRGRAHGRPRRDHRPRPAGGRGHPRRAARPGGADEIRFGAAAGLDVAALGARLGARRAARSARASTGRRRRLAGARWPRLTAWLAEHDLPLADLRAGRATPRGRVPPPHRRRATAAPSRPGLRPARDASEADERRCGPRPGSSWR